LSEEDDPQDVIPMAARTLKEKYVKCRNFMLCLGLWSSNFNTFFIALKPALVILGDFLPL
jgi:hypothetical protein